MTRTRLILCMLIAAGFGDFAFRAVIPAYGFNRNDFSDPYCASWLWRHGQNPYDVARATEVSREMTHSGLKLVAVYPPTAYLLASPLSLLPWKLADLLWALLGVGAVAWMAYSLPGLAGLSFQEDRAWLLAACVCCAAPLHTALHAGNSAAIAVGLCLLVVYLASQRHEGWAGMVLAVVVCLKPQLGIWPFAFYGFRRRWSVVIPASAVGAILSIAALLRMPLGLSGLVQNYGSNLGFWFGRGGMNDFSIANPFRFQLLNVQVALEPLVHSILTANVLAWTIFAIGLGVWLWAMHRRPECDELLALSSLLMLGLVPVYHRSYDGAVALLGLAWLVREGRRVGRLLHITVLPIALLLMPPVALLVSFFVGNSEGHPTEWALAACSASACVVFSVGLLYAVVARPQAFKNPAAGENRSLSAEIGIPVTESTLVTQP